MQPPTWSIRACHALLLSSGMCVAPFLRTCDEAWGSPPQFNITHSALGSPAYCTGASYATASAPQVHEKKSHNPLRSRTPLYVCGCGGWGRGGQAASSAKTGYIVAMQHTVLQSAISRTELQSAQPAAGDDSTAALAPSHTNDLDTAHATAQHTKNGKARQRLVLLQRGAQRGAALITNGIHCRPHVQRNTNRQITTSSSFFGPLHNTTTAPTCVTQYQHLHHNNRRVLPATARCL